MIGTAMSKIILDLPLQRIYSKHFSQTLGSMLEMINSILALNTEVMYFLRKNPSIILTAQLLLELITIIFLKTISIRQEAELAQVELIVLTQCSEE